MSATTDFSCIAATKRTAPELDTPKAASENKTKNIIPQRGGEVNV